MKKRLDRNLAGLIFYQFIEFIHYYIGALLCLYATHWIQSHLPFLAKELAELVDRVNESPDTLKFFLLAIGIVIFRTSSRLLFFYPARILQKELRVELLARLEQTPPIRYRDQSDGQLFQVLQMDMEQLRALIGFALLQGGNIIIAMIVLIPRLRSFHPDLIFALSPLFIGFILFTIIVSRNRVYYRESQDLQGEVQNIIIESYAGKKTIKNFHSEESFIDWFNDFSWRELFAFYRGGKGIAVSMPLLPLGIGASLLWGAYLIFQHDLGASGLVLFSGFVFLFLEPMMFLSWIGIVFARSYGSWGRIKELINKIDDPTKEERELLQLNPPQAIAEGKLDFHLPFWGSQVDLNLPRDQWIVLVGKTGCGKTHLLTRMADILQEYRVGLSYVAQDPYLYSDTLLKNIILGADVTPELEKEAMHWLKLFGLDFLADSPEALLRMEVGEKGKRLSGGQAKRVALIRSIISKAEVLIWDDPFSSVDVIMERQIVDELRRSPALKHKTIVMSSHRITTVRSCDLVYYLEKENGIIESGTTEILNDKEGQLYEYFQKQMV